jgi:hypothetical protein
MRSLAGFGIALYRLFASTLKKAAPHKISAGTAGAGQLLIPVIAAALMLNAGHGAAR